MSQTNDRITQLENEIRTLKIQLKETQESVLPAKTLNNLFAHSREAVLYAANDERLTVEIISDSISSYGYSPEDFTSGKLGWRDVLHPDDYDILVKHVAEQLAKGEMSFEHEHRVFTKSGEIVWITCVSTPTFDADGKVTHFLVKIKDISKRKLYEEKLQDANENLFVTLKSIGEAVILTDSNGRIERLNGTAEKLAGIINLKAKNKSLADVMQFSFDADFAILVDPLKMKAETCKMVQIDEIFMRCGENDRHFRVSCNVSPILVEKNRNTPTGYVLVVKDLTTIYDTLQAAQESEARLLESENTIRGIFDHSADGILLADQNGIIREWSSGYERISGLSKEMAIGKFLWDVAVMGLPDELQSGEERDKLEAELKQVVKDMQQKMIVRHVAHKKTGEHRILHVLYFPVDMPGGIMLGGIGRDVTEEVCAQELLLQNEQKLTVERDRLQTLGDNMPNGCLYQFKLDATTQQMGFTYMSKSWEDITGIPVKDAIDDLNLLMTRMHPDDFPVYIQAFEKSLAEMGRFQVDIRFMLDKGVMRWGRISSTPHMEGPNIVWDGFIVDITDHKRAELEIIAEKERLQALGDNMPNGCLYRTVTNPETMEVKFAYLSGTFEHIMNLSTEAALQDFSNILARVHPDDLPGMMHNITEAARNAVDYNDEIRFYRTGTEYRWIQISSHPHMEGGMLVYDGFLLDITDRKCAEKEMIVEKERLEALGDNLPNGSLLRFVLDTQTQEMNLAYVSKTWESVLGVSAEESLRNINVAFGTLHPDDLPVFMQKIQESAVTLNNFNVEARVIVGNEIKWMNAATHPHMEGHLIVWDGFIQDITDRKVAEQALLMEKDRLQALGDNMPDGCLFRFMMNFRTQKILGFTYLSRTWFSMTGIPVEDTLADFGSTLTKVHPDDLPEYTRAIEESAVTLGKFLYEFRFLRNNGHVRWLRASSSPRIENDMIVWDGFIIDITERKLAEQALLAEKDRLQALGDYFPNGCLFRFNFDEENRKISFSYLSKTWEKLTNTSVEDALRDINIPLSKVHPDDLPLLVNNIWETYDEQQDNFDREFRFYHTPDNMRWLQISAHRHYENGHVVSDGFILDITERKNANRQLLAEKERLEALGNNLPDGSLFRYRSRNLQEYMTFEYVGTTWEKTTGVSVEDTLKDVRNVFAHVHPDDFAGMMEKFDESAIKMTDVNTEARYLHPDGTIRWFHIASHPHYEGEYVVSDGYLIDVSKRKWAEQKLADEQRRLKSLTDNVPNGCLCQFAINPQTQLMRMAYMSDNWERILNSPAETSKEDANVVFSKVHEDDFSGFMAEVIRTTVEMVPFNVEVRYWYAEGDMRWLQISGAPHHEGDWIIFDGMVMDITDRKNADQQLLAEKERVETLGNNLPNGSLFRFRAFHETQNLSFEYVSATWERTTGISAEKTLEDVTSVMGRIHPDDMPELGVQLFKSCEEMCNVDTEARYLHPDGSMRWMHIASHPHLENGAVVSDGFLLDITDRKRAERELVSEKERLQALGDNMPNGTLFRCIKNMQTEELYLDYVSDTWEKMMGLSAEECLKDIRRVLERVAPGDLPRFMENIKQTADNMSNIEIELSYLHPDGSEKWFQVSAHPHREGDMVYSDGFVLDITNRKNAEQALFSEKNRLQALGDNFPNGTLFRFKMDTETEQMSFDYVSGTWEKFMNTSMEDSLRDIRTVFAKVHPDDLPGMMNSILESVVTLTNFNTEIRYIHSDGTLKWFHLSAHPHREENIVFSDGFILDITERKLVERQLAAKTEELVVERDRLETLGNNIPNGCLYRFALDKQTGRMYMIYMSSTWEAVTGVPAEKAMEDIRSVFGSVHPEDLTRLEASIQESVSTMTNHYYEIRIIYGGGQEYNRWLQMASHPHTEGHLIIWDGIMLNVTRRKEAEEQVVAEKERLQALGDNFPNGTLFRFKMDMQTETMSMDYVSGTWEKTLGMTVEDSMLDIKAVFARVHPDDVSYLMEGIYKSVNILENIDLEVRYQHPDGFEKWCQISSHPHRVENMVYSDGFILDVTQRKTAEQELRSEKERLEALGNNIPDGCLYRFSLDPVTGAMQMLYVSSTWGEVTGVPTSVAMEDASAIFEKVNPEDYLRMVEAMHGNVKTMSNFNIEMRFELKGENRWVQLISRPHMEDNLVIWDGILLDITWRKEAERKLVAEKERLEAVGNNLPEGSLYRLILNKDTEKMYMEYVSATWEMVTGLTSESVSNGMDAYFSIVYPDDLQRLIEATEESEKNLTNFNMEIRIHNKDNIRWIQITSHPHIDGNKVIWDGIMTDITRRKEAERELETEKNRLQALGDNIPGGCLYRFMLHTQTGQMNVSYVSATWEKVTGVPDTDALSDITNVFRAVYADDLPYLQQSIQESAQTITNFNCEIRVSNNGRPRWVQMASHPHLEGDIIVWDGIILDVTRRKEAEREVMTEKDRLQALGDNLPNGCLFRFQIEKQELLQPGAQKSWMQHLQLSYASAPWEKISNIPLADALQNVSLPFMRIHSEDLTEIVPKMYESLVNLIEFNAEVRYNYTNTEQRWLQIAAVPRWEEDWIMTDGYILDITERKSIETELAVYREELERLVKERTEELEATNEELYATNEELYATNEEFAVTNEELHTKNGQLQHEIAARKEIMQKLEDSESKVRNFIEQSFEGIMILDNDGRVVEWNRSLEQITGLSREETLGKYEWDLLWKFLAEEERQPKVFEKLQQSRIDYFKGGNKQDPIIEELVLYMPNDSKRYMQVSMFPIGMAETCFFGRILWDITEQKMADMELEQYRTQLELMVELKTRELVASQERLVSLSNNLPGGVIYQMMDRSMENSWFTYISGYFTDMFEIEVEDAMADISLFHNCIYVEDQAKLINFYNKDESQSNIDVEYRIVTKSGKLKWIHMRSSHHSVDDEARVWDGFMIDITGRKQAEQDLENTRRQQAVLIKVLQVVQSSDSLPDALNISLAEMGKYTGVSRVYIFEKNTEGTMVSNTYEWCKKGIDTTVDSMQNIPIEYMQDWFDAFNVGKYINTSNVDTLNPVSAEVLKEQGVKSLLVFPLTANGVNYGFVGFDECMSYRQWEQSELDLLISLSQIISTTTRRYQAEMEIQLSQQTMRTVLDNVNANIFVTDLDTSKILFANKKIKETMGDDIEGTECWKVLQPNKTEICDFCPRQHLRDEHNSPTGLYHWEHYNESTGRWFENTDAAIEWVNGRLVQMEYSTDITDRKRAEEAVRQSEEMYRQLTVASPDAIVVCDPDGYIRYVSPKAMELFGVEENTNISTLRLPKFVHSHDFRQAYTLFGNLVNDNVSFVPQLLLVRRNGSEFFGEISSAPVKDTEGRTTSIIMVIRDVTQRKMSEMELIRAKEKAEESDKLKSAFLANMSHEIRTPLNGIVGFLNFLASDNLSPKRRQEYINVINNSSVQLVKLIDDIIDVAKIEAKQMNIRPVPFRVNDLMKELQVFFETYLQANNKERIALILDDSEFIDQCVIYVDPMRLRQVLNNLIGNAVKFTDKGYIRFGYRQSAYDKLEFVVEDSGIGLAKNQLEVIFERFRQAELSNSRQYGGTGLGLTISRSLVQLMGGEMRVESTERTGSSFYFTISYLPITRQNEHFFDELPGEVSIDDKPFAHKSALVVEPEVLKYKYYEQLLVMAGFTVHHAENIQQWFDFISQTNHVDVVVTDTAAFEGIDIEEIRQVKSVRAGLPTVLIIPGKCIDYQQVIKDSQCNMALESPIDYEGMVGAMRRFVR